MAGTPSLCFLRRGQAGIEKVAQQAMPRDLGNLLEWVNWTAGTTATTARSTVDPALERTGHPGMLTVQPSPQSPQSPLYPAPSYVPAQTLQTIPVVTHARRPAGGHHDDLASGLHPASGTHHRRWAGTSSQRRCRASTPCFPTLTLAAAPVPAADDDHSESSSPIASDGGTELASSDAVRGATVHGRTGAAPQQRPAWR